ncbi:leucine-rich repeat receptor protein kinase HPCA1 isoform X3 [Quercus suber]|uniref:leucine-rich repeat receptor protein kinase HPCA1 isoform X3 n=1 Tax=Quercus suber TaxID=58331 RepID=UPI0032DE7109
MCLTLNCEAKWVEEQELCCCCCCCFSCNICLYHSQPTTTEELKNTPNWKGSADPCDNWEGIRCTNSRVTSLILTSMNLMGKLSSEISQLSELQTLDLSYNQNITGPLPSSIGNLLNLINLNLIGCSFSGSIPDTIGNLQRLTILSLNNNNFRGRIPTSIGRLSNLYWLDLAENQLDGPLPVSEGNTLGLDMLVKAKHFHLEKNNFSGEIPSKLFSSNMVLKHLLLGSNFLTGNIPETLVSVTHLEVIRFDRNSLSGPVPLNLNNLVNVGELYLSNNKLTGPIPDLTGMNKLQYVDMSNNSFDESDFPPWMSSLVFDDNVSFIFVYLVLICSLQLFLVSGRFVDICYIVSHLMPSQQYPPLFSSTQCMDFFLTNYVSTQRKHQSHLFYTLKELVYHN